MYKVNVNTNVRKKIYREGGERTFVNTFASLCLQKGRNWCLLQCWIWQITTLITQKEASILLASHPTKELRVVKRSVRFCGLRAEL